MPDLTVNSQTLTANTAVTKLGGEVDSLNFDRLEDEFNKLLESGVQGLVLDLSGLDSIASAGIGAILNMSIVLNGKSGKLVVASPRPKVQGTLEMLNLCEALTIVDSLDAGKKLVASIK